LSSKCAYRTAIPIPLAVAPPVVPDLHLRLAEMGTGNATYFFEYAILTQKFGFILDVEASDRYPDNIEVEYSYRGQTRFEHSQFCHRSGLALVQCVGGKDGFLWSDNRLFIAAPTRRGAGVSGMESYPNKPMAPRLGKMELAQEIRRELELFCADKDKLEAFWEEVLARLPKAPASGEVAVPSSAEGEGDMAENA
jgi:hypothetical protein